jgi:hypothetical protein
MLDTQEELKKIFQKMEDVQLRYEVIFKSYVGNESVPDDIKHETLTKLITRYEKQKLKLHILLSSCH